MIRDGFCYNGVHFNRFGKSASQAKAGVTLFVSDDVYEPIMEASTLGLPPEQCVISKYEAQRCLILSVCTLIPAPLPHIVIIDEYTKNLPEQYIRYVTQERRTIHDKETGKERHFNARVVKEGNHDIKLSPFDGCGCHSSEMSELWSASIGLDYHAIGFQIRLPFFKGYSIEVPFKEWFREHGITEIADIFGESHPIDEIDCIWNVSMWKASGTFQKTFGEEGWHEYVRRLGRYDYRLGISKYSHHKRDLPLKSWLNYQYLQCLDLWNPKYIDWWRQDGRPQYDILDHDNWGNILQLTNYTTNLYEKIIKGDKGCTLKFLGIQDTTNLDPNSAFVEAALLNDQMLKDPCIRRYLLSKLKSWIQKAKYGKIYADGFYHTCIGDMIGYLEYAAGIEPRGCLEYGQFYCDTIPYGKVLSFRSPLVCPSEVNDVEVVINETTQRWFSHFKDQDVVMLNMYDLSLPRQGGMDTDGDAVFLCHDPLLVDTKIDKAIIIDVEDKATAQSKPYTIDNIIEYEMATRDTRIGEITTVATSILNQYTENNQYRQMNADNVSLLRIFQGKEIDYIKTGVRWQMNKGLRKQSERIPYFLLYNYPKKLKKYEETQRRNRGLDRKDRAPLNAYRSPSPMNELCDYVCTWHRRNLEWDRTYADTRPLIVDYSQPLNDRGKRLAIDSVFDRTTRAILQLYREYDTITNATERENKDLLYEKIEAIYDAALPALLEIIPDRTLLANYAIDVAYGHPQQDLRLVWRLFGDVILDNIRKHTPRKQNTMIVEYPHATNETFEFLGRHYFMIEGAF